MEKNQKHQSERDGELRQLHPVFTLTESVLNEMKEWRAIFQKSFVDESYDSNLAIECGKLDQSLFLVFWSRFRILLK